MAALLVALAGPALPAWDYDESNDAMTGKVSVYAKTVSANAITFPFPYGGPQRATLMLRIHPRYGRDIVLQFKRAQFLCGLNGCDVLVRFDDKPHARFRATAPADHSIDSLFIRDYSTFVRGVKAAKSVRIEAQFYQAGSRVMEFDVADLQWAEPPKPVARTAKPAPALVEPVVAPDLSGWSLEDIQRDMRAIERRARESNP